MPLRPGLSASADLVVDEDDTALALHTGDVPVLATPRVVSLAEEASVRAIEGTLTDDTTSVGYRVQLDHLCRRRWAGRCAPRPRSRRSRGDGSPSGCR